MSRQHRTYAPVTHPVTHLVYAAAGSPAGDAWAGGVTGLCRLCGEAGAGRPWEDWVRSTFTDHDLLCAGHIVCTACLFCAQERTQMWLAGRLGKAQGQRMRNYSHFVADGEWRCLTKAEKREMRELLYREPEVAVIADSGQRHLLFRARPGWWQFETLRLRPEPARMRWILEATDALYAGGASKAEIGGGRYSVDAIGRIGPDTWRTHESRIRRERGSPLFRLAVFLTLKDETHGDDAHIESGGQLAPV